MDGTIVPVLIGSGLAAQGMKMLLLAIAKYFPSPKNRTEKAKDMTNGELIQVTYDNDRYFSAKVFKVAQDPQGNRLTYLKVTGGVMRVRDVIQSDRNTDGQKINQIRIYSGKSCRMVDEAEAISADAIVGVRYGSSQIMQGAAEVIAYGTAVRFIEK
jgi:elongation factor G